MQADVFQRFHNSLSDHLHALVKGIYVSLPDGVSSQRLKRDLWRGFREAFSLIWTYDPINGLCTGEPGGEGVDRGGRPASPDEQMDFLTLLDRIGRKLEKTRQRALFLLDGVDGYLNDDLLTLKLAELFSRERLGYTLVFLGFKDFPRYNPFPRLNIHEVPYPTPCRESLRALVRRALVAIILEGAIPVDKEDLEGRVADSLFGCPSLAVAEDLLSLACPAEGYPDSTTIGELKLRQIMSRLPGISVRPPQDLPSPEEVLGLSHLKSYCEARREIFLRQGEEIGIPLSLRGICVLGPPGTGKSLFARALARSWGIPYCSLSLTFMSKFFGESERNLENIFRMLTDFGGPVLFHLDELSRLFGGHQGEAHEVTRRILAMLLGFLESPRSRNVYTVGTMNHLEIDPALLRRFDDLFYVGLPTAMARAELFRAFFAKYGISLPMDEAILAASQGMVGDEIERVVKDLKVQTMRTGGQPSPLDLIRLLRSRPPLAELFPEISGMEDLAVRAGFRLASPREKRPPLEGKRGRG